MWGGFSYEAFGNKKKLTMHKLISPHHKSSVQFQFCQAASQITQTSQGFVEEKISS